MNSLHEWHDAFARMRIQSLAEMGPTERAVFAVAAAAHCESLKLPWPTERQTLEAGRLAAEFGWLLEAAILLQGD